MRAMAFLDPGAFQGIYLENRWHSILDERFGLSPIKHELLLEIRLDLRNYRIFFRQMLVGLRLALFCSAPERYETLALRRGDQKTCFVL